MSWLSGLIEVTYLHEGNMSGIYLFKKVIMSLQKLFIC